MALDMRRRDPYAPRPIAASAWRTRKTTDAPQLHCGCGNPVPPRTSHTEANPARVSLSCKFCHLWIWQDLLNKYAEEMVFYCHSSTIDSLQEELDVANQRLQEKQRQIDQLEAELLRLEDLINSNSSRAQQAGTMPRTLEGIAGLPEDQMSLSDAVMDKAITTMQANATKILSICKDKLQPGKTLNSLEVKDLRAALEAIAEILDQDSLLCQEVADAAKKIAEDDAEPSDGPWPESSPELHPSECLSRKDHIESFWGVDYDSDNMPSLSN